MRTWQTIRNWFKGRVPRSKDHRTLDVRDEIVALLDLSCYTASQAVMTSKLIEGELKRLNCDDKFRDKLVKEHSDLEIQLQSLRTTIETLNTLLNTARAEGVLGSLRTECKESQRMMIELLNEQDMRELIQVVEDLKQSAIGSVP